MVAIFATTTPAQHVQFLHDGSAVVVEPDKPPVTGRWWTSGDLMITKLDSGAQLNWPRASLTRVVGVPAGSRLVVRLLQPLSSVTAKEGMPVDAVLIAPAMVDGKVLIPPGSVLKGKVTKAQPVGMAVVHEKAALTVEFDKLELPNGDTRALHCRLYQVENSRERVDASRDNPWNPIHRNARLLSNQPALVSHGNRPIGVSVHVCVVNGSARVYGAGDPVPVRAPSCL